MDEITIGQLRLLCNEQLEITLDVIGIKSSPDPYKAFVRVVERAIDWIAQDLARNPELCQGLSEDQLTSRVITPLRAFGLVTSHETKVGGHCDIVVEAYGNMLWLAEAKIHSSYDWLFSGFLQLESRYSTGIDKHNQGGMIIYCYGRRLDQVCGNWQAHLVTNRSDVSVENSTDGSGVFYSSHIHDRTGLPYRVRHTLISLHFNPRDRRAS